jgi:hypothetical protein
MHYPRFGARLLLSKAPPVVEPIMATQVAVRQAEVQPEEATDHSTPASAGP